jgi:hypothetical protein
VSLVCTADENEQEIANFVLTDSDVEQQEQGSPERQPKER